MRVHGYARWHAEEALADFVWTEGSVGEDKSLATVFFCIAHAVALQRVTPAASPAARPHTDVTISRETAISLHLAAEAPSMTSITAIIAIKNDEKLRNATSICGKPKVDPYGDQAAAST